MRNFFFKCLFSSPKRHFFFFDEKQNKSKKKKKKKRSWFCRDTYVMTGAMTTRETQQKRRMIGKRNSLWGMIVKNDDICFRHILPRLNGTDLKFLGLENCLFGG